MDYFLRIKVDQLESGVADLLPPIVPIIETLTAPIYQEESHEIVPEIEPYSPPTIKQTVPIVAAIEEYNDDEWEYYWEEEEVVTALYESGKAILGIA